MKGKETSLRLRAEERFKSIGDAALYKMSAKDIQALVHELEVHQIELQMQNEELQKTQIQLEEVGKKYSELYEFAPCGYFSFDKDGVVLSANLTGALQLGVKKRYLINKQFYNYIVFEDRDIFFLHLQKIFETNTRQTCELRLKKNDSPPFYAQLESITVLDGRGNFSQCRTAMSDITQRRKAQEEVKRYREHLEELVEEKTKELKESHDKLIQSEKRSAMSLIASEAAHEINNPLSVIKAGLYYLKTILPQKQEEEIQRTIHMLDDAVNKATSYVHELLNFSKPPVLKLMSVEINEVLEESLKELPAEILAGIKVTKEFEQGVPGIQADPERLKEVFINLIKNASESMGEVKSKKLEVRSEKKRDFVMISVSDTGKGIAEEGLRHIFDPFFTTKRTGTGLGLAICHRIIEAHNGEIEAKSKVGQGTTFIIRFPVEISGTQ